MNIVGTLWDVAAATSDESPTPVIDGFSVYEVIGQGGFSRVFRAKQHSVGGREVAIKVLNKRFRSETDRHLFESECLVAGRLDHPNIVRVYQATMTDDDRGCIVMERMAGTYRDASRMTIAEVIDVGVKIADVVDEAHRQGIVHHDLKPSNLFKSNRGEPALGDFGIATIAGRQTGKARMTLRYAPPEKLSEGISDSSGDIYSFGATLFELASGTPPYVGETDEELIRSIVFDPVPRLDRADAPESFTRLIERCMAKDPAQRPASAREIVDELRRIQSSVGAPRRPIASPLLARPLAPAAKTGPASPSDPSDRPDRSDRTFDDDELGRSDKRRRRSSETSSDEMTARRRWPLVLAGVTAVGLVVAASLAVWFSDRGEPDVGSESTTAATVPTVDFVVVRPPSDFSVERVENGFRFTWTTTEPGAEVWIHRVGFERNVSAAESPFVWETEPQAGGDCFEARTVLPDGAGLSQAKTATVCA